MIDERFVFLAVTLNFFGGLSYLIDTIKGKVKPNRVTWFLRALAPLIAFFAEVKEDVGVSSLMTFMVGFNPLLIFLSSFVNKKSEWKITRFDLICGALSLTGLMLWSLTRIGSIAISFSIIADFMAAVPTLVKAFKAPETENYNIFVLGGVSAFITILTIKKWDFVSLGFPSYIFLICIIFVLLIRFKVGKVFDH